MSGQKKKASYACVGPKEKGKLCTTPSFALAMLIVDLVGVVRGFRGTKISFPIANFILSLSLENFNLDLGDSPQ